jgi:hypothetical protein
MKILLTVLVGIIILASLAGNFMSDVEQPEYKLIRSKGDIEIRDYSPMILAEVEVGGERKQAISDGFKILADYIFGNNTLNKNIELTAPLTNEQSKKMAMTAPVIQKQHMGKWKIRFIMPKKYTLQTVPKPNSKNVTLILLPATRFAVIRFSGLVNDQDIKQHTSELQAYILDQKLSSIGEPLLAFYNPPWTLPFLRRNEVMIEIKD